MISNNSYKYGSLPEQGALGTAYVPLQKSAEPAYEPQEALSQGTLFPGLNLPFMNVMNAKLKPTALNELMAIDFVIDELELYLDTHKSDSEAFKMLESFLKLRQEGYSRYVKRYGPVLQTDLLNMNSYDWLNEPWPWDYSPERED